MTWKKSNSQLAPSANPFSCSVLTEFFLQSTLDICVLKASRVVIYAMNNPCSQCSLLATTSLWQPTFTYSKLCCHKTIWLSKPSPSTPNIYLYINLHASITLWRRPTRTQSTRTTCWETIRLRSSQFSASGGRRVALVSNRGHPWNYSGGPPCCLVECSPSIHVTEKEQAIIQLDNSAKVWQVLDLQIIAWAPVSYSSVAITHVQINMKSVTQNTKRPSWLSTEQSL